MLNNKVLYFDNKEEAKKNIRNKVEPPILLQYNKNK